MDKQELKVIIENHKKWLNSDGGVKADLNGADLREANLSGADLSGADLREANLSGANLNGADLREANLSGANLRWANLSGADLRWADLSGADLRWADLSGADLRWADLSGAKNTLLGGQRSDGYQFYLTNTDNGWRVVAGCRNMSIAEYRKHIKTYNDEDKEIETKLILNHLAARLKAYKNKHGE